jgi:hypothetical protein
MTMVPTGFIANWLVPRELLPQLSGVDYELVTGCGETAVSACFVHQPISRRAQALTIPQLTLRAPVLVERRPMSLLLELDVAPLLAHAARWLAGIPTRPVTLELGVPDDGDHRWGANAGALALTVRARPGLQLSSYPSLASEQGFHRLIADRPTVVLARGTLRRLPVTGGFGAPVPARAITDEASLLAALFPSVDDWPGRLAAAWMITPTAPIAVRAPERSPLVAEPC